ncbi:MAG: hypothetical protein A2133_00015 [Actinobacteria bacterium RBG_16_64_13]|nr:MAG: hypothetical protein A2133_00015 [Actinobacteria bacterium RBG_16_64_13]
MLFMSVLTCTVLFALFLLWAYEASNKAGKIPRSRAARAAMTFGASCVAVGVFLAGAQADAVHALTKVAHRPRPLLPVADGADRPGIHHDQVPLLPRFSAKMSGATQAPVSLVFLGSGADLLEEFGNAGWHAADRVTPRTAVRACARGLLNRPYPTAPVFPSFLEGKLHDVAFQRTDAGGSSRRRHHVRWWLTDFTCEGKQVWVATASYDAGVGLGRIFPMPIHHIDPDIDAERDYIVRSLTASGRLRVTQEVRITQPMTGRNAAGDSFYTQGTAFVLA